MQVKQQSLPILSEQKSYETREYAPYPYLSFGAIHNVKQKKFDIDSAKEKLLRQLNEILEANLDIEELYSIHMRKFLNEKNQFIKKAEMLFLEMQEVEENEFLRPEQRLKKYAEFHKRHMQLEKESRKKWEFVLPKKFDEKIDFALLNSFKTAALEDNFNFEKVYQDYYKDLSTIDNIQDIPKRYPNIKIPVLAHIVVAEKIESCLTRDFYEDLSELMLEEKDEEEIIDFCQSKVKQICVKNPNLSDEEYDELIAELKKYL